MKGVASNRKTVYPSDYIQGVVGRSAPDLNHAIACWAAQLLLCVDDNAQTFPGGDWYSMREAFRGFELEAFCPYPGAILGTRLRAEHFADARKFKWADAVAEKLDGLDYAHAHALLAVIHRAETSGIERWWTKEVFTAIQK